MLGFREFLYGEAEWWVGEEGLRQMKHRLCSLFYPVAEPWVLSRHRIFAARCQMTGQLSNSSGARHTSFPQAVTSGYWEVYKD